MPKIDLLQYRDFDDPIHTELPSVGQDAGEWFGKRFEGQYVVAVGNPIHTGKHATVVLAYGHRSELAERLIAFVNRSDL